MARIWDWGAAKLAEVEARGRVGFAGSGISAPHRAWFESVLLSVDQA
jgi:hypothetical protein